MAVGIAPSTDLGKLDLEIDTTNGGIVANSELAARSDVYVVCWSRHNPFYVAFISQLTYC